MCFQTKQRCIALEEQLVDLVILAMERSENEEMLVDEMDNTDGLDRTGCIQLWQHLSSQLIFFVLFQFASFPHMVIGLYEKVTIVSSFRFIHYDFMNLELMSVEECVNTEW